MIGSVSGQRPAVQGADESVSIQSKIEKLEQQKKALTKEMERIKKDDTIDKKTAASKVKELEKKIAAVEQKIKELKQKQSKAAKEAKNAQPAGPAQKGSGTDQKTKEGLALPKDYFQKGSGAEQWDSTYSLIREAGKTRIKYLRPKDGQISGE